MKFVALILICVLFTSCSITQRGEMPEPIVNTVKVGAGLLVNTVKVGVSLYCGTFHNLHRNVMKIVKAYDPEWVTICDQYSKSNL